MTSARVEKIVRDTLAGIASDLRSGKLTHVRLGTVATHAKVDAGFNMAEWECEYSCGTVCCIGGWMHRRIKAQDDHELWVAINGGPLCDRLNVLFYPPRVGPNLYQTTDYDEITAEQAADAIDRWLAGESPWGKALPR